MHWLEGKITVNRIRVACFAHANTELGIGYPENLMQQMVAAKLVTILFEILVLPPTHWNWLNIQVMEKIASVDDQTVNYYKEIISSKTMQENFQEIPCTY